MEREFLILSSKNQIDNIIRKASILRLAINDENGFPYIIPVSYGYDGEHFYICSNPHGKKVELIAKNPKVGFEIDIDSEIIFNHNEKCYLKFKSISGTGKALLIEETEHKKEALNIIMRHYGRRLFDPPEKFVNNIVIIKIKSKNMSGRKSY